MEKKKKFKMTFEVIIPFETLIDEETFKKEYKGDLFKLCKFMNKEEGFCGWYEEPLKLIKAEFI